MKSSENVDDDSSPEEELERENSEDGTSAIEVSRKGFSVIGDSVIAVSFVGGGIGCECGIEELNDVEADADGVDVDGEPLGSAFKISIIAKLSSAELGQREKQRERYKDVVARSPA